jgi:hypothetical protein
MKIRTATFLPIVALAVASLAQGQTATSARKPPSAKPPSTDTTKIDFVTVDKDQNGSLSREESKAVGDLDSSFAQLDADKDEVVSPAEFLKWKRAGKIVGAKLPDPTTAPSGSAGAQHMPGPTGN